MKTYSIKKLDFLNWYFEDGQDSENAQIRKDIGEKVVENLFMVDICVITTRSIFTECNHDAIPLRYLQEFRDSENDTELGDLGEQYELKLIE
jgi:hypothetical protein